MRVFWSKGFDGTSLSDLTAATGVSRPSLYLAFGNKEALFKKALERYARDKLAFIDRAIEAPTARSVAETLLRGMLALVASDSDPKGCLGVNNLVACGAEAEPIRAEILTRTLAIKDSLTGRFERAQRAGEHLPCAGPAALAAFLIAILQGMALQAASGASPQELATLVDTSLERWPAA